MALVKCPECGRENVSDSAVACPDCGYGIKAHFDKIKAQEIAEKRKQEAQKQAEEEQKRIEQRNKELAPERQKQTIIQLEKKINEFKTAKIIGIVASIGFFVFWIYSIFIMDWPNYIGFIASIFFILYTVLIISQAQKKEEELRKAKYEYEEYEKIQIEKALEEAKREAELNKRRQEILNKNVPCPVCGSRNTVRISTMNRATSIAVTGLASGKIGKQYQCKDCKHLW